MRVIQWGRRSARTAVASRAMLRELRKHLMVVSCLSSISLVAIAQSPGALQPQFEPNDKPVETPSPLSIPPVFQRAPEVSGEASTQRFPVRAFNVVYYPEAALDDEDQGRVDQILTDYLQQQGGKLSLAQCQDAADSVSRYFQQQGYFLARAVVPAQRVSDGEVKIQIFSGKLGAVSAPDLRLYREAWATHVFDGSLDQPVMERQMESMMLRVNDLPGLSASGVFGAGESIGQTQLRITPNQEDKLAFALRADNYGLDSSGEYRLTANATINNVTTNADRLSVTGLVGVDPNDIRYGALNYAAWLPGLVHSVSFDLSRNDYDISDRFSPSALDGETDIGAITVRSQWLRQRALNIATEAGLAVKQAEADFTTFMMPLEDNITVASVGVLFDAIDTRFRGLNQGALHYYRGLNSTLGSIGRSGDTDTTIRAGQSGDFDKYVASFSRVQTLSRQQSLWLRVQGQYSSNVLSSLEQMSLGGPYSVRAYPVAEFVRDKGVFTSATWSINAPGFADQPAYGEYDWGDIFSLGLFVDYAAGSLNRFAVQDNPDVELAGVGVEASLEFPGLGFVRMSLASPLTHIDASDDDDPQFWFVMGVNF
ncbi:ShlB/FhaC/HecB family hemolysin secretion/activation protein [bacterium]|nr:ShlB/FhaC/HecB family hemolysin secretion/activation protein [bacterium]